MSLVRYTRAAPARCHCRDSMFHLHKGEPIRPFYVKWDEMKATFYCYDNHRYVRGDRELVCNTSTGQWQGKTGLDIECVENLTKRDLLLIIIVGVASICIIILVYDFGRRILAKKVLRVEKTRLYHLHNIRAQDIGGYYRIRAFPTIQVDYSRMEDAAEREPSETDLNQFKREIIQPKKEDKEREKLNVFAVLRPTMRNQKEEKI